MNIYTGSGIYFKLYNYFDVLLVDAQSMVCQGYHINSLFDQAVPSETILALLGAHVTFCLTEKRMLMAEKVKLC